MKGNGYDIQELTRIEAYLLSEKAGHPSHMHDYFWTQAEAIVRQRAAIVYVAVKAAGKKSTGPAAKAKPATAAKTPATAKKPVAAARKKTPEPQLALGDAVARPKPAAPAKKKAAPATGKSAAKPK